MALIGAICIGLVWGWLTHHVHQPASRPGRSMMVLLVASAAVAAYHWWQIGSRGALFFGLAALFGAMGHGAWMETLRRRNPVT